MSETNTNPEARARDEMAWIACRMVGSGLPRGPKCAEATPCEACYERGDAIIAALAAEGKVIVPRDGSPSIFEALRVGVARGDRVKDVWAAAIATPTLPPAGDER